MRKWAKEPGLLLANAGIFLVFFGGMIIPGAAVAEPHYGTVA